MKEDVLQCLKKYGQRLDLEIAAEMRLPLATVRSRLAELSATGAVVMCSLTRYDGDKTIEALECRLSGPLCFEGGPFIGTPPSHFLPSSTSSSTSRILMIRCIAPEARVVGLGSRPAIGKSQRPPTVAVDDRARLRPALHCTSSRS